jgi:hypothetical protein
MFVARGRIEQGGKEGHSLEKITLIDLTRLADLAPIDRPDFQ